MRTSIWHFAYRHWYDHRAAGHRARAAVWGWINDTVVEVMWPIRNAQYPVLDVASPQGRAGLTARACWDAGFRTVYIKLGGDNVGRYVAPYYVRQVDEFRAQGFRIGHYWVPDNAMDPAGAADYFMANLRGWTSRDFVVLDNETLDDGARYSDSRAAVWIERVKSGRRIPGGQVLTYSGLADARATAWPAVLGTGSNFIIAAYSYPAFGFPQPATIPVYRIVGHQTGGVMISGIATDVNAFKDYAFDYASGTGTGTTPITEEDMSISFVKDAQSSTIYVCSVDNGKRVGIKSMSHFNLLDRFRKNDGSDPMLVPELDIVRGYLRAFEEGDNSAAILAAIEAIAITPEAVRDAIKAAIAEGIGITIDATVSDAQLDAAFDRFAKLLGVRIAGGDLVT